MSIRQKTLLTVVIVFVTLSVVLYKTLSSIILNGFVNLETTLTIRNLTRVEEVINNQLETINMIAEDWATWTDTYKYVQEVLF